MEKEGKKHHQKQLQHHKKEIKIKLNRELLEEIRNLTGSG